MVRYGVAKWRRVDWRGEAGVVDLSSRQLCDPHLHHAWIWRMGPWRLASGVWHAATIISARGMHADLVIWLCLLCRVLSSDCIDLTEQKKNISLPQTLFIHYACRVGHEHHRCPATMPHRGLCDFNNNYVEAFEPGKLGLSTIISLAL